MASNNQNNPAVLLLALGDVTATKTFALCKLPKKFMLTEVSVMNNATLAADNTNYLTVSLQNGSTEVAELDTRAAHENGLTSLTGKGLNIATAEQAKASNMKVVVTIAGTGALTAAMLAVTGYWL